jgi:probable HAF family extracellular repeat protein
MNMNLTHPIRAIFFKRIWFLHLVLALMAGRAWSQEYTVTDLGTLGGGNSTATGVNNLGQVSGYADTNYLTYENDEVNQEPFLYSNGTMNSLNAPDGVLYNYGLALNDAGTVVGLYYSGNANAWNGFQTSQGTWTDLAPTSQSYALAINESGVAAGANGSGPGPFLVTVVPGAGLYGIPTGVTFSNGEMTDIPAGNFLTVLPSGINNAGQISGECVNDDYSYFGCLVTGNEQQLLQVLHGYGSAAPFAIDAAGNMCGTSYKGAYNSATATTATYWAGSVATNLGTPVNTDDSSCAALNDYGTGVGAANVKGGGQVGTIYDPVNGARNLNSLVTHIFRRGAAFSIQNAVGISDRGYIAANCFFEQYQYAPGYYYNRACLLTPNWGRIVRNDILALAQGDRECSQCRTELEPEADSLPPNEVGLSVEEEKQAVATLEEIQTNLLKLGKEDRIPETKLILLLGDTESALRAFGYVLP